MEKEKLYNAARSEAFDLVDCAHQTDSHDLIEAFVQGAEWLQSQPIADRLTETERERIKTMYNQAVGDTKGYYSDTWDAAYAVIEFCEEIFGKEMFEPKNNNI